MSDSLIHASSTNSGGHAGADGAENGLESNRGSRDRERTPGGTPARSIDAIRTALASVPDELSRLLAGRSADELSHPSQDGGWGIVEILPHFLDWERVIRSRVDRILAEDTPVLEEHDDSLWAIEHDYSSQDPLATLSAFGDERLALVDLLEAVDDVAWSRGGILPKHGDITLRWLLNNVCDHDARHLVQVKDVLA